MPSREALVLLPGMFGDYRELWSAQEALLGATHDLLPIDLVGDSVADFAGHVLERTPPRFNLVGLSLGGHVALEIVRRAPRRLLRLALICVTARPASAENIQVRQEWERRVHLGQYAELVDELLPLAAYQGPGSERALPDRLKQWAFRLGAQAFSARNRAMMTRIDSRPTLASVRCPTLVIAGREDRPVPLAEVEEVAGGIEHARLVVLDRCGHSAPIEQPAAVTKALRGWLSEPAGA